GGGEPVVVLGCDRVGESLAAFGIALTLRDRLPVQEAWLDDRRLFGIVQARHTVLALRRGDQLDTQHSGTGIRTPLSGSSKEGSQLMELVALPDIAGMIVTLGTLNLDAQKQSRRFRGPLVIAVRPHVAQ